MTIYNQDLAKKMLNRLCEKPNVAAASRAILGSDTKLWWLWCDASLKDMQAGNTASKYLIQDWPEEGKTYWLHEGHKTCRVMAALTYESQERDALMNSKHVALQDGKVVYETDYVAARDALELDELDWLAKYGNRSRSDIWKRTPDGKALVPLLLPSEQPAAMRVHALRSLMSQLGWDPAVKTENVTKNRGFMILAKNKTTSERQQTPLRADLELRLAELRQKKLEDRVTKPEGPVKIEGRGSTNDPPERTSSPHSDPEAPAPRPNYSRPAPSLNQENRHGMPSGGFSMTRNGKPT